MNNMLRNIKISKKISYSLVIMLTIPLLLSYLSLQAIEKINHGGTEIHDNYLMSIINLTELRKNTYEEYVWLKVILSLPMIRRCRKLKTT